jgi:DNA-binding NarL/FixJ family response regulator
MSRLNQTYLFCFDEHRTFFEDVRKRFSDTSKYKVVSFSSKEELLKHLTGEKEHGFCKVAVLVLYEVKENGFLIENLTREIKKIDPETGLILVYPGEIAEDIKKTIKFNIDAYIPRNSNSILRLHNIVKRLISKHNLEIFRKRRNRSLYILIAFLLLCAIVVLLAYLKLPEYF